MHKKIYCSLCGKDIKDCTCKKSSPIETKVAQPEETKAKSKNSTDKK